jgi:hypothetical protein
MFENEGRVALPEVDFFYTGNETDFHDDNGRF